MLKLPKFTVSNDKRPKYTVKEVAEMMGLTTYAIRYYENSGLIPGVIRTSGNTRMFSEYTLSWLRLVLCLRVTGLPVEGVRHYIRLCEKGDSTIKERAELIFAQERSLKKQIHDLNQQLKVLKCKKDYYETLLQGNNPDRYNPAAMQNIEDGLPQDDAMHNV